jgi:hypothetical protein
MVTFPVSTRSLMDTCTLTSYLELYIRVYAVYQCIDEVSVVDPYKCYVRANNMSLTTLTT